MPTAPPRLIGLPYDASSSYLQGAAEAPALIREALRSPSWNTWCEQARDVTGAGGLSDGGDLTLPPTAEARALIEAGTPVPSAGSWRRALPAGWCRSASAP